MPSSSAGSRLRRLVALLGALVLLPLAVVVAAAPAQATPNTASGSVYDALGDPLTGVTVTARPAPAYTTKAATTTTIAGGGYSLPLSAGTYRLEFVKAGYQTAFYGGEAPVDVVVDGSGDIAVDGEPVEDNVLDDVTLTSQLEHTLTGTVTNGSTGLSGIAVEIFAFGDDETPLDSATTNGSGSYSLTVPSGRYELHYTDPTSTYLPTSYGGATPTEVIVAANGGLSTSGGPIACTSLCAVTLTKPAVDQEFPIAGQVVDAGGDPVGAVHVAVTPVGASSDSGADDTTTAGEQLGVYSASVLPGTYRVSFSKTGWVSTRYGGQASPSTVTVSATGILSVAPTEDLSGNRLNDVALASQPFAVSGDVHAAGTGNPIEGITVRALPRDSTDPATVVDTDTTSAAGTFTLALPVGAYDLEYTDNDTDAPTYTSTTVPDVRVAQGGTLYVAGDEVAGLAVVTLDVSSADTPHPVSGSVVDANGADIDGLSVAAVPVGAGTGDEDETGADGVLGDHGRYRLLLKPGAYNITIEGGSAWQDTTYPGGDAPTALVSVQLNGSVLVNGAEMVTGDLGETVAAGKVEYPLSGTVTDGTTGLPGITVTAYAPDDLVTPLATTTSSGAAGAWSLASPEGLVVGSYVVQLSGTSGGTTYDRTYVGGSTPSSIEMAQGGVAKVNGSPVTDNALLPVVLVPSSADQPHPVLGEVVDANGDPIDGVMVTGLPQGGHGAQATSHTGADGELGDHGRYRLPLKAGTYRIAFSLTGFSATTYPGGDLTPVDVVVELDGTVRVAGAAVPGGELGDVELSDSSGTTTISGRVTSEGSGVGGIVVEVFPEGGQLTDATRVGQATTPADGTWSVGSLTIGEYTVRFTDNGVSDPVYNQTFYGGSDLASSTPVKVGQGDQVSVSEVPKPGGALGDTATTVATSDTTYAVVGELDDEAGDPIDGATVTAVPQSPTPLANQATDTSGADGELGDHGRYRLALKPGTYHLTYTAPGFTGATYPGAGETVVPVTVAIGGAITPDALEPMTLAQATGTTALSGRVTSAGAGVNGITVDVLPEDDTTAAPVKTVTTSTVSGAAGSWSASGLKIGVYTIRFTDNVPALPNYIQTFLGGADLASSTPVKVGQGSSVTIDGVPQPGGALGSTVIAAETVETTYPLLGDVTDPNGDPLPEVTVTAVPKAGGALTDTASTDTDGAYALHLRAGTYEIEFSRTGYTTGYYLNADDARAQVVVTSSGATISEDPVPDRTLDSFTLRSPAKHPLTGRVLGAGSPLTGITVRAVPEDTTLATVTTTSAGGGTFTLQLPVGTYRIEYVGRTIGSATWDGTFYGGSESPSSVKVATGGSITVVDGADVTSGLADVTLQKSTGTYLIRGSVSDEAGDPLAGATVRAFKAGTTTLAGTATTEVDGEYAVEVPVGKYSLRFEKAGKATTWLTNASSDTGAHAIVTVAPGGALTAPGVEVEAGVLEDVQLLLSAATFKTLPRLTGAAVVGRTVTAKFGAFNGPTLDQDLVTVEWFLDGRPADDFSDGDYFQKFLVTAAAATKRLSFRLTIEYPNDPGGLHAATVFTSKAVTVPKATATVKGTYQRKKLTVTVKVPTLKGPTGTVVVKDGKRKVATIKLKAKNKGKVVVRLKLKRGKHKLTLTYSGTTTVKAAKATVKVKVR
ncbi:beta strand repeat-containing protein [Nocardioides sp. URHA0020]|uniref:beta strand repeat-containing protein n=1 Tax=Nocardioides sp. URHA0020 TaxID=1380392 RepID=UPI00048D247E|nr:carboxypeptidase-like regulatory domain-containing protein [Nocardioides sp. URHA0020]